MRRICGGDGFGVPRAKRSAKKTNFKYCLNLKMKDPESIAEKNMVEYNNTKAGS